MTHYHDKILTALKEAIINVFWKRTDVRSLFQRSEVPQSVINSQDWQAYKYHIVSPVLDSLNSSDDGLRYLNRILQEVLSYTDGDHLLWLSDGPKRKREAERCLEHLRLLVKDHNLKIETEKAERLERQRKYQESQQVVAFQAKLTEIKDRYFAYFSSNDLQRRGYALEEILYDLFLLFELNPKGPFRRTGEQIDGAFSHGGDHFLLEAKWQSKPVDLNALRDLDGAVNSSFDNTLGLFVSIYGFSEEALSGYVQGKRPCLICMDGMDLTLVCDGKIDLNDLLDRKQDIAVHKRKIFVSASAILQGAI